jgi:transposase InsO family protein
MRFFAWLFNMLRRFFTQAYSRGHGYRRRQATPAAKERCKPPWVVSEVIRLKALMPDAGCRLIADSFNRRFAHQPNVSVGKTYVSDVIRNHLVQIHDCRQRLKHRRPKSMPTNRIWGIDLTGKSDAAACPHTILGIIDHGSRACLLMERIPNRTSLRLLTRLVSIIRRYGMPEVIRTDNEAIFTSLAFKTGLALLGIRHQRSQRSCPWQNGRIERLFGTLKHKLERWVVADGLQLDVSLRLFRFWYNHVRPHQHLEGMTPAEVWGGTTLGAGNAQWFEAWDGLLAGYYSPS